MSANNALLILSALIVVGGFATEASAQDAGGADDARASEIIELNNRLMRQQIIERDATLFRELALDQFLVIAPGGRIEDKSMAASGVNAFDAKGIDVRDEQVIFEGNTAVLIGRLQIDGEMMPLGQLPPMKFMAVYIEGAEGWRLLSRSLTPCLPIAIENGFC